MEKERPNLLALAGSLRSGSYNKKLVRVAVSGAEEAGAEVRLIDLKDYPMPLFDQDIEDSRGIPENGVRLKEMMKASHGLILSSPEYNSSVSGVLKNAIDWVSRPYPGEAVLECFRGKTAVLMSASPGRLGGLRGLYALRWILANVGVIVLPDQHALSGADTAFDEGDNLVDAKTAGRVKGLGSKLAEFTAQLIG